MVAWDGPEWIFCALSRPAKYRPTLVDPYRDHLRKRRAEGVNTKTKMIKRQMYGRAGFTLLRHRILLG